LRYRGHVPLTRPASSRLLDADDPDDVREALRELSGDLIVALDADAREALAGSVGAARTYVRDYRQLAKQLLVVARSTSPDRDGSTGQAAADLRGGRGGVGLADAPLPSLSEFIAHSSAAAPFSSWTGRFDIGDAIALDLASRIRELVGAQPLQRPPGPPALGGHDLAAAQRFLRHVRYELNHPDNEPPLPHLMDALGLSKTELGRLFGVSRQAIDQWLERGVPADRQEKLGTLLALVSLLERKLKPGRLPGVARRPAAAYGDLSMLELIRADRHRELLDTVRASFDWATAA
jgi:hypothetical protein